MSRIDNQIKQDPAKVIIKWSSNDKCFTGWVPEKEEKVVYDLPFSFIVLDQLQKVTGFSEKADCAIYSNMIGEKDAGIFKVRGSKSHPNLPIVGKWKDIKEKVDFMGGRWTRVIYALVKSRVMASQYEVARIELSGAAVSSYFDIRNPYEGAILVKKAEEGKKGSVKYSYPVFESAQIGVKLEEKAVAATKELKEYIESVVSSDVLDDSDFNGVKRTPQEDVPPTPPPPKEPPADMPEQEELPLDFDQKQYDEPTDDLPF